MSRGVVVDVAVELLEAATQLEFSRVFYYCQLYVLVFSDGIVSGIITTRLLATLVQHLVHEHTFTSLRIISKALAACRRVRFCPQKTRYSPL